MSSEKSPELKAIEKHGAERSYLIPILHDIQKEYNYLPEKALRNVASIMNISLVDVYGVATFFTSFSLQPRGKHQVLVCLGTACHVRQAQSLVNEASRFLGIEAGETTEDMLFSLDAANCLGACALGPIAVIDGKYHGQMDASSLKSILEDIYKSEGMDK